MSRRDKLRKATFEILGDARAPALQLQAATWRHLLEVSAQGMCAIQLGKQAAAEPAGPMLAVELAAIDFDALLVAWLDELIVLGDQHGMLFPEIEILQLDFEAQCIVTAMIGGTKVSQQARSQLQKVASPAPRVRETKEGLTCRVFFAPPPEELI